jgi:hypothetical protein
MATMGMDFARKHVNALHFLALAHVFMDFIELGVAINYLNNMEVGWVCGKHHILPTFLQGSLPLKNNFQSRL